ncbi:MAG: hypothetical protein U1E60_10185 [Reyranellaceae bacterium]
MIQLKSPGAVPAPDLFGDSDPTEPPITDDSARTIDWAVQADLTEPVGFVSPPPMPWPRIFPSL